MFDKLKKVPCLYCEQKLQPAQGDRFQPTGFPDLGAAVYDLPGGRRKLLVESVQSMANRLETALIESGGELIPDFEGLSYLKANISGDADTFVTSLTEPHRINSPWFTNDNKGFRENFLKKACYKKNSPLNWKEIGKALFFYDVNSLLHGCFLVNFDSRIKIPRALSAFIEADNPREALSGGVKFDSIDPGGTLEAENNSKKSVYGNVPFQRMEYTAETITAYFSFDLELLRGFALEDCAFELLVALGLYKIRHFLEVGHRLRTACDLLPAGDLQICSPKNFTILSKKDLLKTIQEKIPLCTAKKLFADPPVTELKVKAKIKTKKEDAASEEHDETLDND